jgi:hypothetical protein
MHYLRHQTRRPPWLPILKFSRLLLKLFLKTEDESEDEGAEIEKLTQDFAEMVSMPRVLPLGKANHPTHTVISNMEVKEYPSIVFSLTRSRFWFSCDPDTHIYYEDQAQELT